MCLDKVLLLSWYMMRIWTTVWTERKERLTKCLWGKKKQETQIYTLSTWGKEENKIQILDLSARQDAVVVE